MSNLEEEMKSLLNQYSVENESNTPDYVLARYLFESLDAFNKAVRTRELFYGRNPSDKKTNTNQ